jgi:hypothetical protein
VNRVGEERVTAPWRACVLLSTILAAFAGEVEQSSTLEVAVRVDPPVEAASFPAQVLVVLDSGGSGFIAFRIGFLCAPEATFSTTVTFDAPSRHEPESVGALIVPAAPGQAVRCGPLAVAEPVPFPPDTPAPPLTTARLQVVGGCGTGDVSAVALVL